MTTLAAIRLQVVLSSLRRLHDQAHDLADQAEGEDRHELRNIAAELGRLIRRLEARL